MILFGGSTQKEVVAIAIFRRHLPADQRAPLEGPALEPPRRRAAGRRPDGAFLRDTLRGLKRATSWIKTSHYLD